MNTTYEQLCIVGSVCKLRNCTRFICETECLRHYSEATTGWKTRNLGL